MCHAMRNQILRAKYMKKRSSYLCTIVYCNNNNEITQTTVSVCSSNQGPCNDGLSKKQMSLLTEWLNQVNILSLYHYKYYYHYLTNSRLNTVYS